MTDSKDLLYLLDWLVNTMIPWHDSQYLILSDLWTWLHDYEITDWFNRLQVQLDYLTWLSLFNCSPDTMAKNSLTDLFSTSIKNLWLVTDWQTDWRNHLPVNLHWFDILTIIDQPKYLMDSRLTDTFTDWLTSWLHLVNWLDLTDCLTDRPNCMAEWPDSLTHSLACMAEWLTDWWTDWQD